MRSTPVLLFFCCLLSVRLLYAQAGDDARQQYIDQYSWLAVQEMERSGIPASIKLGQALLESRWGTSELAQQANNHFGIKCGGRWNGESYYKEDDDYVQGELVPSCFRAYTSVQESFVAHSDFLMLNARYADLFTLQPRDYQAWARGLKQAGYATARQYHQHLINLIEELGLHKYDYMSSADFRYLARNQEAEKPQPPVSRPRPGISAMLTPPPRTLEVLVNNDVKYVISRKGVTLEDLSNQLHIPVRWLLSYNPNIEEARQPLADGLWVYIQPRRKNYRGRQRWHEVVPGDDMFGISQRYGISLRQLYERNQLLPGTEPAVGAQIKIRGWQVNTAPAMRPTKRVEQQAGSLPDNEWVLPKVTSDRSPGYTQVVLEQVAKPVEPEQTQVSSGAVFHRVAIGDDLVKIARKYNQTVEQLRQWNNLSERAVLMIGLRLRVQ